MRALETGVLVAFVACAEPREAREFYEGTLGLSLVDESPYALEFETGGTMLRVTVAEEVYPAPYTVLGWGVEDIAASIHELADRGVEFVDFDEIEQDELGIWTAPGGTRVAWFRDPDGNLLSLSQS
jgi:catechol 2,3-dioxygenase-like lactoylglutathione lyase family enzyme